MSTWRMLILAGLINAVLATTAYAEETLIFAIDLIRHGDRTPIYDLPNFPYSWKEGLGELTAEGMNQEFQRGMQFRQRYIEQNHLLPPEYHAEAIYVRSSDINRTLMSAESVMMGLYPLGTGPHLSSTGKPALPSAYQPIPIHTVPLDQDKLFISDQDKEHIQKILKQYVFTSKQWQQKTNELQSKFKHWSEASGLPINSLDQTVVSLGNNLYIRKLHHVPLPKGISEQDAKEITATGIWAFSTAYQSKEITDPVGHAMLSAMGNYFDQARQHKTKLKYVLFSGHDSTIMCVLNTLGAPLINDVPPYASDLNFSLYQNADNYYVKISFNGKPVIVPACHGNTCSLQQFLGLMSRTNGALTVQS